jgi:hypothetical protein
MPSTNGSNCPLLGRKVSIVKSLSNSWQVMSGRSGGCVEEARLALRVELAAIAPGNRARIVGSSLDAALDHEPSQSKDPMLAG